MPAVSVMGSTAARARTSHFETGSSCPDDGGLVVRSTSRQRSSRPCSVVVPAVTSAMDGMLGGVPENWSVRREGRVAVATFTRPPRNFMSFAAMGQLEELLTELGANDAISVVVLTGGVPGYFVAHADLDDLSRLGRGEPVDGHPLSWPRALALAESIPQPVVAAINGQAWGGGCELSLACTLRVMSTQAHVAQPEVNVGIIPGAGGTQRLPRLVGPGAAAELILSGRVMEPDEAFARGFAQAVLPDDGFVD